MIRIFIFAVCCLGSLGCSPKVRVVKNPGELRDGIRYYRPKPYLLITPYETVTSRGEGKSQTRINATSETRVQLELQYLPDFAEEYSIQVRTGLGSSSVNFQLENGWNLVSIGQQLDSKFDKNVEAVGNAAGAIAEIPFPGAS
ncbi:MAG: hypothetical protein VX768_09450, partial [Planctomycetota bacterium]|nr:hypothetical protein [Planctomycetota bacterium]